MSDINAQDKNKVLKNLNPTKIFIPIFISLAITGYLLVSALG